MSRQINIAILEPDELLAAVLLPVFMSELQYNIRVSAAKLCQIEAEVRNNSQPVEALIMPVNAKNLLKYEQLLASIKSSPILSAIPLFIFSNSKDLEITKALTSSSLKAIFTQPYDREKVYLEICGLLPTESDVETTAVNPTLTDALMSTLHIIDDAVVILDQTFNPVFANRSARGLLRIFVSDDRDENSLKNERLVFDEIHGIVRDKLRDHPDTAIEEVNLANVSLRKGDRSALICDLKLVPVVDSHSGQVSAFCLLIRDNAVTGELLNALTQSERVQSLALLLAAGCFHLSKSSALGIPGAPVEKLEKLFLTERRGISLLECLTGLLEVLDLALPKDARIVVSARKDYNLDITASDFFQLVGNLLFYSINFNSGLCSTDIRFLVNSDQSEGQIAIISTKYQTMKSPQEEHVTAMLRSSLSSRIKEKKHDDSGKISAGILIASRIAAKYSTNIVQSRNGDSEIKLTVNLGILSKS